MGMSLPECQLSSKTTCAKCAFRDIFRQFARKHVNIWSIKYVRDFLSGIIKVASRLGRLGVALYMCWGDECHRAAERARMESTTEQGERVGVGMGIRRQTTCPQRIGISCCIGRCASAPCLTDSRRMTVGNLACTFSQRRFPLI